MLKLIIITMLFIISILDAKATNYWKNYEIIKQKTSGSKEPEVFYSQKSRKQNSVYEWGFTFR